MRRLVSHGKSSQLLRAWFAYTASTTEIQFSRKRSHRRFCKRRTAPLNLFICNIHNCYFAGGLRTIRELRDMIVHLIHLISKRRYLKV